jgi:hypothetical protein
VQRDARVIESIWRDGSRSEREATLPLINRFMAQYPNEPRNRTMRLRLAWLRLITNDLNGAKSLIDATPLPPAGSDRDMARVLEAAILAQRGQPRIALAELRELGGGLVDPEAREWWAEQALSVAEAAHAPDEAVSFMLAWRANAFDEQQHHAERVILERLSRFDVAARRRAFERLLVEVKQPCAEENRQRARTWLLEAIRDSLASVAETTANGTLARRLVADAPASFLRSPVGERLRELARSSDAPEAILHASIGLLLELDNDKASRKSAELVTGAMRALGTLERDEAVRLITREIRAFNAAEVEDAVTSLVTDGAALLVAGMSPKTATLAARVAFERQTAVILLSQPENATRVTPFQFFVESPEQAVEGVVRAATSESRQLTTLNSDDAFCSTEERFGWTPEFLSTRGDVLVASGPACATRLAGELKHRDSRVRVWLGPDAASAADAFDDVWVVTSAKLTEPATSKPVAQWIERFQRAPTWFEALGYDVTRLGIDAIRQFGFESARGEGPVRLGRERVRDALARVESDLMTTEARGFAGSQVLAPALRPKHLRRSAGTEKSNP